MQSTLRFSNVEILALTTTSLIYNFWHLGTVDHIFVGKKGLDATSALENHPWVNVSIGHNVKWDHFELLAKGRSDTHCKIKETLIIQELKRTLKDNVSSEKLYLY